MGSDRSPDPLYCELSTPTHPGSEDSSRHRLVLRPRRLDSGAAGGCEPAAPVGVSATTGMVRDVMRWYSANPGYRSACSAYLSSRSAPCSSVACTSTMSSPTSMRTSGLAFRFQYQAGLSSAPAFEANTRYRSPSARYIMILVRGFPLRAPTECRITSGAP